MKFLVIRFGGVNFEGASVRNPGDFIKSNKSLERGQKGARACRLCGDF